MQAQSHLLRDVNFKSGIRELKPLVNGFVLTLQCQYSTDFINGYPRIFTSSTPILILKAVLRTPFYHLLRPYADVFVCI